MNGIWTDTSANTTSADDPRNWNVPNDGKFDQTSLPSNVELQIGRVDLANMTKFPDATVTETDLLRRYLQKTHQYRHRLPPFDQLPRRGLMRDGCADLGVTEPLSASAWGAMNSCLGRTNGTVDAIPADTWFPITATNTYLFGYGCSSGSFEGTATIGSSQDFGTLPCRVVFPFFFGSWHGDWDRSNNFLRAPLAGSAGSNSFGLACFWSGRPEWFLHHLGMGATLGAAARLTQNNTTTEYQPSGDYTRETHVTLLGDPSLRLYPVASPRNLDATNANTTVQLAWDASTETGLLGYHVYRAGNLLGPFTRLTATPLPTPRFTDSTVVAGQTYTYMVRTLKLETVPGGSFQNLSQGAFATITTAAYTAYQQWCADHGLPTTDPGTGASAGDGIPNLLKYALGIDPHVTGYQGHLAPGTTNLTSHDYLMLTYTRPEPSPADVIYTAEAADELAPADWTTSETVELSSVVTGSERTITFRDLYPIADRTKRFIHLKVHQSK